MSIVLGGTKISGADIRDQNGEQASTECTIFFDTLLVLATQAIANVVKSSFGPSGLDKMMVDDIGVHIQQSFCKGSMLSDRRTSQ